MNIRKVSTMAVIFGSLIIFLAASYAAAQKGRFRGTERNPDQIMSVLKDRLSLTEEQEAQVRPIMEEQIEKQRALFEKYRGKGRADRRTMRDEMQKNQEDTEKRLEGVLSKEQMDEFRKIRDEKRNKMRGKGRNRRG
ncbi:hypothetical protein [Desulfonema magnum]|uniref:Periplasmic heavy metal sensor n=1 Tax=Desulfonema magnum TaxID=45655 RepID=A0A975BRQ7_9BACT|nr:hypothetical protein [Desulfonema magnum]QTA90466.1 Uncharacterized protein dnm_065270 [Desulfonema magnum]